MLGTPSVIWHQLCDPWPWNQPPSSLHQYGSTNASRPWLAHQSEGNNPRVFWTLTLSTNKPTLAPESLGFCSHLSHDLVSPTSSLQPPCKAKLGNQPELRTNQAHQNAYMVSMLQQKDPCSPHRRKNTLEGINSRFNDIEEWISEMEDKVVEIIQAEQKKRKRSFKWRYFMSSLKQHQTYKCSHYKGPRMRGEKGTKNLFKELRLENFPNLWKERDIQIQESQKASNKLNPKRSTPRYIIIKMSKITD